LISFSHSSWTLFSNYFTYNNDHKCYTDFQAT